MIKTVIFDIDGTMYDYESTHRLAMAALQNYCACWFGTDAETFHKLYDEANRMMLERIGMMTAATHNRMIRFQFILEQLGQPLFPHVMAMYHTYWDTLIGIMLPEDGIISWMKQLKADGIRIGAATNLTAYVQYRKLEKLGISPYVDWIVTSEETGEEKPAERFFRQVIDKSGVLPEECLFVGDSIRNDVEGAVAAGMNVLHYAPDAQESGWQKIELPGRGKAVGLSGVYEVINSYRECLNDGFLESFA